MIIPAAAVLAGFVALAAPIPQDQPSVSQASAQPPARTSAADARRRETHSPSADLDTLTLVMSTTGRAVVRFGADAGGSGLIVLERGDRIGRTAATVREIAPGRLVLDELTRDKNGRPHRAQIVLREGQPGGRRYMRDPGLDAPTGVRPQVLGPDGRPAIVKKPGTRP